MKSTLHRLILSFFLLSFAASLAGAYGPPDSYGKLAARPHTDYKPAVPPAGEEWKSARFGVVSSELSPATLYLNRTKELHLFGKLSQWGLGGPTSIAYIGPNHSLQAQSAQGISIPAPAMEENWILVWFQRARGWTEWDSPWLIVLQHHPANIEVNADGIHLTFSGEAGVTAVMPMYGYSKLPHSRDDDVLTAHEMPSPNLFTDSWMSGMPLSVIQRAQWWSRALRWVPLHCRETFSVDRSLDRLTLREEFEGFPIADDWKTPTIKLAPLPPTLALAFGDKRFPMTIAAKVTNPDLFTAYGPYLGVEGKDRYEINLDVLQYLHETEVQQEPDVTTAAAKAALAFVKKAMADKFPDDSGKWAVDFGPENFCWAAMSDRWYPKGLAYADPAIQTNAKKALHSYFADWALKEERFTPFKGMLLLAGPGIGTWGGYDDAGKFSSNFLIALWSYAHYTGDWSLIKERWPLIKRLFVTPLESDWKGFGRSAIAELGDEAPPAMAMARMAYKVGDADTYLYASYVFAREMLHHFVKQVSAPYFRAHQPYHSMEWMPEDVRLTNLWGDTAGWQIDGPEYPKETGERQFNNRWVRFGSEDVGRFYQDHLKDEVKKELDHDAEIGSTYKPGKDDGHIAPSMERLRSLLLNETPDQLVKLTPPENWSAQPDSGKVALGLSFLRTSKPPQTARIIPKEGKSPFVLGLERQVTGRFSGLVQNIAWEYAPKDGAVQAFWPIPVWHFWKPPYSPEGTPVGNRWPFGEVRPAGPDHPKSGKTVRLNWNTEVTTFDF